MQIFYEERNALNTFVRPQKCTLGFFWGAFLPLLDGGQLGVRHATMVLDGNQTRDTAVMRLCGMRSNQAVTIQLPGCSKNALVYVFWCLTLDVNRNFVCLQENTAGHLQSKRSEYFLHHWQYHTIKYSITSKSPGFVILL